MLTRLQKLRKRAQELQAELEKRLADALDDAGEPRSLTDEERTAQAAGREELEGLVEDIREEERLASIPNQPTLTADPDNRATPEELLRRSDDVAEIRVGSDRWVERGFASLGEQLQAIHRASNESTEPGDRDKRLAHIHAEYRAISGLSESVPSDGGFLLQKDFIATIRERMHKESEIISRVRKTPISASSTGLKFNAIQEDSRVDGSRGGGVRAYWRAEGDAFTKSKFKLRQVELTISELIGLMYSTGELIADAPALTERANRDFSDELRFVTEDAIWEGDGSGKPLGMLGHAGTINITKESGQAANTIVPENIVKMYSRARNRQNGVWMINQDIEPQLWLMSLAVGTGGGPVFMPAGGLSGAPFATLLGRPVIAVEFASTLGTSGDIAFCDWDSYEFIDKGSPQFDSSIHVRFLFNEQAFRAIYRLDGQPLHNSPLTPFKGSTTTAHFITLATRA